NAGTLQLGNAGTLGSIADTALNLPANTWLAFNRTDSVTNWMVLSGAGGLVQKGTGTLVLTNANSYTGLTTVSAGTLKVNNSTGFGIAGNVTVNAGTLGGSGTIAGLVTIGSGGHLAPGNSVGTLTVGSLTMSAGGLYDWEFNGSANDKLIVTSA